MIRRRVATVLLIVVSIASGVAPARLRAQSGSAQAAPAPPSARMESVQDLTARLAPAAKQQFDNALQTFNAQRYPEAAAEFKQLLLQTPNDAVLLKFASEAAVNAGDTGYALGALKPLAEKDPDDWQTAALLTRACAESGDAFCRDTGIAHMLDLHRRGITPAKMLQYTVEHIQVGANTLILWISLEPWGRYQVYDFGQVKDGEGKIYLRITIESNDADQGFFAKEHPKEAAAGLRSFSLDGYRETGLNSTGQRTQTHATYQFFVGQPSYATVREAFIKIAGEKSVPISSRTNLTVP